jgi:hypothetical protein
MLNLERPEFLVRVTGQGMRNEAKGSRFRAKGLRPNPRLGTSSASWFVKETKQTRETK